MQLTDEQADHVRRWAAEGATLGQIQQRLREEFSLALNYMETRLLLGDLGVSLLDKAAAPAPSATSAMVPPASAPPAAGQPKAAGGVSVSLDELTPPYAVVSGKVVFSDGARADWHVDDLGRLSLNPATPGYKPAEADLISFQRELRALVQGRGM